MSTCARIMTWERAQRLGGPETMKNCKRNSIFSDFFSQNSNRKMLVFVTFLQKCFKIFKFVCGCYADIFECLGRDEGVFSPKVKKESKNQSIEARTSRDKNRDFCCIFQKGKQGQLALIITFRNRHGFAPALEDLHGRGGRYDPPILRCARLDRAQNEAVKPSGVPQAVPPGLLLYC